MTTSTTTATTVNDDDDETNPYDALGISRTSSAEHARKVFLEKCKLLHPDKRRTSSSSDEFERMKRAYEKIRREEESEEREKRGGKVEVGAEVEVSDVECGRTAFADEKFETAIEFFQRALSRVDDDDDEVEKAKIHAN